MHLLSEYLGCLVRLQRQIVKKAEKELELYLLPKDFADRCVCRCQIAVRSKGEGGDKVGE